MKTPWGDADMLRERMLPPGPGRPREEVERNQRERLYAATVACVAGKGYEETSVADLIELSGVSRSAFYEHFRDKEDCFLATFEAIVEKSMEAIGELLGEEGSWEQRSRAALRSQLETVVEQPAAAWVCFNGIYAAGPSGRHLVEGALSNFAGVAGEAIERVRGQALPEQMVLGALGGAQAVIQSYLQGDRELLVELADELWEWALGYEPPGKPLRAKGRPSRPLDGPPPFVAYSRAERIIRALADSAAERGYPAVTIAEVAGRASVSQATFYSHFADKETALVAALDSISGHTLGVVMPAARRAPDWPNSIRAAIGALCGFFAAEPNLATLVAVEVYAAGGEGLKHRRQMLGDDLRSLIEPGYELAPETKPIVADAVLGALWALLYVQIATEGPRSLPKLAPLACYVVLAPFIGAESAVEVANGDGIGTAR